jgi:hypothetical protein
MSSIIQNLKLPNCHVWWVALSILIALLSVAVLLSNWWDHAWFVSALLWFSLSAAGPAFIALALQEISKLRNLIVEIFIEPPSISVQPVQLAISGIVFLCIALETMLSVDFFPFNDRWANHSAYVIACTFFLSYGALAYVYVATLLLVIRLGNTRVWSEVFLWPHDGIAEIYSVYVRLLLVGGTSYILAVAIVRFTPWANSWSDLNETWILLWVFPPGLALIVYFVAFSVALHKVLLQCRARAEQEINEQLHHIYDAWKSNREIGAESSISALLKWRESVRLERIWPMDLKAGIATIVTLLIPSIEAIAKLVR